MKNTIIYTAILLMCSAFAGCAQKQVYTSPPGYDLTKPVKYIMPDSLHEISGIAFRQGNAGMLYAEEDEHGRVYYLHLGDKTAKYTQFRPKGDFEDMAICGQQVVMLQSKGVLFTLPLAEVGKPQTNNVQKWEGILPDGEYEGLYADEKAQQVYVLCKHCSIDKTSKTNSGFIFDLGANGGIKKSGDFVISVKHIEDITGQDKVRFHPSGLSQNPVNGDWWILSSVNKMLVVADSKWKVRQVYLLDPALFTQPEGITFDNQNNLYISNEGGDSPHANVLEFPYQKTSGN
ncbi:SdiA-regulated family protein [Mucilaginibacter sp. PPCGB 2223]|nr:SdiA-regulated family protein [Mucilaginibacter sp. PPCGB 2223]